MGDQRVWIFSELATSHGDFDVTDVRAMAALREAEANHFWHRARKEEIGSGLRRVGIGAGARFLELGCGSGCVSSYLCSLGLEVVGVEGHRELVMQAADRAPRAKFWVHDLSRGVGELPADPFDVVGLFDVLEHLAMPGKMLEEALRMVSVGGWVVGTVPALMALWSRADEQAGHRTRYDESGFRGLLESLAGCQVQEVRYFNRVLVPLLWVRRRVVAKKASVAEVSEVNFRVPPRMVNEAMVGLLRVERKLSHRSFLSVIPGASLWFALKKA